MSWDEQSFLLQNAWPIGTERGNPWDERYMSWDELHIFHPFFSLLPRILLNASSLAPRGPGKQRGPKEENVRIY
ncbi:hypothetical protein D3H65_01955 [Paraflavitalea soli]|uniref:Uncharacterized protein n=1 Tax=Paraflavitalea soli TaxID=2315862 RepID=A0A3B7MGU3_9BACT|nr:hypothetical protein D3H65_01955 [Paraflavitalea soli]